MIFEDPDELGYSTHKPAISLEAQCNLMMPKSERDALVSAAINAHEGHHLAAAGLRVSAGYGKMFDPKHWPDDKKWYA